MVQCSRALRPASAAATSATAKSLRVDRRGVASINGAAQESVRGGCADAARAASLLFDAIAASSGKWTSGGTERE